jgi:hypothetical protein
MTDIVALQLKQANEALQAQISALQTQNSALQAQNSLLQGQNIALEGRVASFEMQLNEQQTLVNNILHHLQNSSMSS